MGTRSSATTAARVDPARYVGRYENIQSTYVVDANADTLQLSMYPKGDLGMRLSDLPLAFIDRETAVLHTGNPQLDRQTGLFSDIVDGRYAYMQVGGRQYRRVG